MENEYYFNLLNKIPIADNTKRNYITRLKKIEEYYGKIYKQQTIHYLINNPDDFEKHYKEFLNTSIKKRIKDNKKQNIHTVGNYVKPIQSILKYDENIDNKIKKRWKRLIDKMDKNIRKHYNSNEPSKRDKENYVSFTKLIEIRENLPKGDNFRLFLSLYTMIPPVRNNYWNFKIYKTEEEINDNNENYMIMNIKNPMKFKENEILMVDDDENISIEDNNIKGKTMFVFNSYKTSKYYSTIYLIIPDRLKREIEYSLKKDPRKILFYSTKNKEPYKNSTIFTLWYMTNMEKYFKKRINLNNMRHIYITRRDLKLERKSREIRQKYSKIMGHSLDTQDIYRWTEFVKEDEMTYEITVTKEEKVIYDIIKKYL
jgi:hypothetical protein